MLKLQIGGPEVTRSIPMAKRQQFGNGLLSLAHKANTEHNISSAINASHLIVEKIIK